MLSNGYVSSNTTHASAIAIHNNCSGTVLAGNLTLCGKGLKAVNKSCPLQLQGGWSEVTNPVPISFDQLATSMTLVKEYLLVRLYHGKG